MGADMDDPSGMGAIRSVMRWTLGAVVSPSLRSSVGERGLGLTPPRCLRGGTVALHRLWRAEELRRRVPE